MHHSKSNYLPPNEYQMKGSGSSPLQTLGKRQLGFLAGFRVIKANNENQNV